MSDLSILEIQGTLGPSETVNDLMGVIDVSENILQVGKHTLSGKQITNDNIVVFTKTVDGLVCIGDITKRFLFDKRPTLNIQG